MKTREGLGGYVMGQVDALGIAPKIITAKSGVHPSTFSRFVNGIMPLNEKQLLAIGIAIGEAKAETKQAKK